MTKSICLSNLKDSEILAQAIAKWAGSGRCLLLSGDLGAGKTTLTRYICKNLGVDERQVTSPTFSLVHEYVAEDLQIAHMDLYRLGKGADVYALGLDEYIERGFFVIVEWADFLQEDLDCTCLFVNIRLSEDGKRYVELKGEDLNSLDLNLGGKE